MAGIGWRRRILLAEACRSPELLKPWRHTRFLEDFCGRHGLKLELFTFGPPSSIAAMNTTPFASPLFGSSLPGSPVVYSPEPGHQHFKMDGMPPLSLEPGSNLGHGKGSHSPPSSPPLGPRQLAPRLLSLQEKLQGSPQVGVVHLALHSDVTGMVVRWVVLL